MDENTTDGLVGYRLAGDLSILHSKIDGGGVQPERTGAVRFHRVVIAGLHREIDLTVTSGGDGIHQSVIAGLTDLECSVGNPFRFICCVDLGDLDTALRFVIKIQRLGLIILGDLNGLRRGVQNIAGYRGDLFCRNGHAGGETGDDHTALAVAHIAAIVRAYIGPGGVCHQKFHSGQRLIVFIAVVDVLLEDQRFLRIIIKPEVLRVVRVDHHGLALGFRINGIAGHTLYLCCHDGARDSRENDLPLGIAPVQAVGGQLTILIRQERTVCISDLELRPLQRRFFVGSRQLVDDQIAQRLIAELEGHGLTGLDLCCLRGIIQQIAWFGPGFTHHQHRAGVLILHQERPAAVRHEFAVGIAYQRPIAGGDQKFHIGKRFFFLVIRDLGDQQSALGGVAEVDLHDLLVLAGEVDCLRRCVDDVSAVAGELLNDISASFTAGDGKGAILRGLVDADHRAAAAAGVAAQIPDLEPAVR